MKRSSGARLCATAAVGALSLSLITSCSDGGSDGSKDSGSPGATTAAAKALSAAELQKLIIAQGEVNGYEVGAVPKTYPASKSALKGDEKCKPLMYVMSGLAPGDAAVETNRMATAIEEKKPTDSASKSLEDLSDSDIEDALADSLSMAVTVVSLSSYDGDGAEKAVKSVSDAVKGCAGGFTGGAGSDEQKFTKVTAEKPVATGDEAVAFGAAGAMEDTGGKTGTVHAQVVRHGNTVATYYTMNFGAMMSGKQYTVPDAVIQAQSGKLK